MALSCINGDTAALEPDFHAADMALQSHSWRMRKSMEGIGQQGQRSDDVGIVRHEPYSKIE